MKRILSFDGGGVRGALSARIIEKLESEYPYARHCDVITGTSTGGLIALCLAHGMIPARITDLYRSQAKYIFKRRKGIGRYGLFKAKHNNNELFDIVSKVFGKTKLRDLRKRVLIPTFDLESESRSGVVQWGAKFFHNFDMSEDLEAEVVDVAMATSAAPTYLPTDGGYTDGGLAANNPTLCAAVQLIKSGVPLATIEALSIGAGRYPQSIGGNRHDWGIIQWGAKIIPAFMAAASSTVDYQCRQLLGANYHRVDIRMANSVGLNDYKAVPQLIEAGEDWDSRDTKRWIGRTRPEALKSSPGLGKM